MSRLCFSALSVHPSLFRRIRVRSSSMSMSPSSAERLFVAKCLDREGGRDLRQQSRAAHLDWIVKSDRTVLGGPLLDREQAGPIGSLLIVKGSSVSDVVDWSKEDPYGKAGLFADVTVKEWKQVFAPELAMGNMVYAILCTDRDNVREVRAETRAKHLDWWKSSGRNGYIGPFPAADGDGAVGSMIITDGESLSEAESWAKTDPYNTVSLFERVDVYPMKRVIENGKLLL